MLQRIPKIFQRELLELLEVYRAHHRDRVLKWRKLKEEGVSDQTAQEFVGISRATYYRSCQRLKDLERNLQPPSKKPKRVNKPRWGEAEKQLVLKLRRENPTYGKAKLAVILKRDHGQTLSESSVGRILKVLKEKGLVQISASAVRAKRKRSFTKGHAKPWTYKDYRAFQIGERVQIDHMTVTKNGVCGKHFQAWDRKSKVIMAHLYSNATSMSAKKFLLELVKKMPFKILSIQVDGGSEFRHHFEDACANLGIPLIVLPPKKPTYNGGVERGNRIFREEFYAKPNLLADSVGALNAELQKAANRYNAYRPHANLNGLTPFQYINKTLSNEAA